MNLYLEAQEIAKLSNKSHASEMVSLTLHLGLMLTAVPRTLHSLLCPLQTGIPDKVN
jgi:hypothetical protein